MNKKEIGLKDLGKHLKAASSTKKPSGQLENYYLPDDTRETLENQLINHNRVERSQRIDNFSLLLNKCRRGE